MTTNVLARHHLRQRRSRARGQVEILSTTLGRAVAVIGVISVIAVGIYIYNDMQTAAAVDEIEAIVAAVDKEYGTTGIYQGLSSATMAASKVLSNTYVAATGTGTTTSNTLITPWHGPITLTAITNPITQLPNGAWTLTMQYVPTAQCNQIAVNQFTNQIGLAYGGTTASSSNSASYVAPLPAAAASACAGTNGAAQMVLSFT